MNTEIDAKGLEIALSLVKELRLETMLSLIELSNARLARKQAWDILYEQYTKTEQYRIYNDACNRVDALEKQLKDLGLPI